MSNDSKPPANLPVPQPQPQPQPQQPPQALPPMQQLLDLMRDWTNNIAMVRCAQDAIKENLKTITEHEIMETERLGTVVQMVTTVQAQVTDALQVRGVVGLLMWFAKETQKKPYQMIVFYLMVLAMGFMVWLLGGNWDQILSSAIPGLGSTR